MEGVDVLPVFLKERDQEVGGEEDVGGKLVFGHLNVANSNAHAEHLLELPLDGSWTESAGQ